MAGGPLPKRVTCPTCRAPEGMNCRDPETYKPVKPHKERLTAAQQWYTRVSPDGLTPERRDAMVEELKLRLTGKGSVGAAMAKITTSPDPEAEFARLVG